MKQKRKARRVTDLKPDPPADQHQKAVDAMAPYVDEFQEAVDDEVRKDFGIVPKGMTPTKFRKQLFKKTARKKRP